jgi:hypothetical protein
MAVAVIPAAGGIAEHPAAEAIPLPAVADTPQVADIRPAEAIPASPWQPLSRLQLSPRPLRATRIFTEAVVAQHDLHFLIACLGRARGVVSLVTAPCELLVLTSSCEEQDK